MPQPTTLIIDGDPESRDTFARLVKEAGHSALTAPGATAAPAAPDTLARLVKHAGHSALPAAGATEALALISTLRPQVVLVDLDAPGTDPFELIHQIRLESTDTVVLALSTVRATSVVG